jgi:hypothetical protein
MEALSPEKTATQTSNGDQSYQFGVGARQDLMPQLSRHLQPLTMQGPMETAVMVATNKGLEEP